MQAALREAKEAYAEEEIPIGAVIVCNDTIIARGHNQTERLNDVTAHAEMIAFTAAANYLGSKYLTDCTLYVTVEPCPMCAGASYWSQVSRIVFGAYDEKRGYTKLKGKMLHPKTIVTGGIMEAECGSLVKQFFEEKRK